MNFLKFLFVAVPSHFSSFVPKYSVSTMRHKEKLDFEPDQCTVSTNTQTVAQTDNCSLSLPSESSTLLTCNNSLILCNSPSNVSSCHSVESSSGYSSVGDGSEDILRKLSNQSCRIAPTEYHVGIRPPLVCNKEDIDRLPLAQVGIFIVIIIYLM